MTINLKFLNTDKFEHFTLIPCSPAAISKHFLASVKPERALVVLASRGGHSSKNNSSLPSPKRKLHKGPKNTDSIRNKVLNELKINKMVFFIN